MINKKAKVKTRNYKTLLTLKTFFVTGNKSFAHSLNWNLYTDTVQHLFSNAVTALEDSYNQTEKAIDATPAPTLELSNCKSPCDNLYYSRLCYDRFCFGRLCYCAMPQYA